MRAFGALLDRCSTEGRKIYTYLYIVNRGVATPKRVRWDGSRPCKGAYKGANLGTPVFYQHKQRSGWPDAVQRLEDRMHHFQRLGGIAAVALATADLSACYPPPTTVAVAPPIASTALPPQPPPAYLPPTTLNTLPPQPPPAYVPSATTTFGYP